MLCRTIAIVAVLSFVQVGSVAAQTTGTASTPGKTGGTPGKVAEKPGKDGGTPGKTGGTQEKAAAAKIDQKGGKPGSDGGTPGKSIQGTVKSLSASSITVVVDNVDRTFAIESTTRVVGKGFATVAAKKTDGKTTVTDLVSPGDQVTVRYADSGSASKATEVRVTSAKK